MLLFPRNNHSEQPFVVALAYTIVSVFVFVFEFEFVFEFAIAFHCPRNSSFFVWESVSMKLPSLAATPWTIAIAIAIDIDTDIVL